jgi:hypothetical protein
MTTNDIIARDGRVHPVHVAHLVMGLAFLGLVGVWAAVQYDVVPTQDVRWLLPLPWVFAGVAGLLAVTLSGSGRRDRRNAGTSQQGWVAPAAESDDDTAITTTAGTIETTEEQE